MPVIGVWSLIRPGLVAIEPYEEKRLGLFEQKKVRVTLVAEAPVDVPGIEGSFLTDLQQQHHHHAEPGDLQEMVRNLIPNSKVPYFEMIYHVEEELASKGLAQSGGHRLLRRLLFVSGAGIRCRTSTGPARAAAHLRRRRRGRTALDLRSTAATAVIAPGVDLETTQVGGCPRDNETAGPGGERDPL
jgi:hypothetical protein